jgi:hypothetical protein
MHGKTIVLAVAALGWLVASLIASQYEARQKMSPEQRAAEREEQSVTMHSVRFFRHLGISLTLIGGAGFAYYQL